MGDHPLADTIRYPIYILYFLYIPWKYKPSQPIGDHPLSPCPLRVVSNFVRRSYVSYVFHMWLTVRLSAIPLNWGLWFRSTIKQEPCRTKCSRWRFRKANEVFDDLSESFPFAFHWYLLCSATMARFIQVLYWTLIRQGQSLLDFHECRRRMPRKRWRTMLMSLGRLCPC